MLPVLQVLYCTIRHKALFPSPPFALALPTPPPPPHAARCLLPPLPPISNHPSPGCCCLTSLSPFHQHFERAPSSLPPFPRSSFSSPPPLLCTSLLLLCGVAHCTARACLQLQRPEGRVSWSGMFYLFRRLPATATSAVKIKIAALCSGSWYR